jgi:hypothetical protein
VVAVVLTATVAVRSTAGGTTWVSSIACVAVGAGVWVAVGFALVGFAVAVGGAGVGEGVAGVEQAVTVETMTSVKITPRSLRRENIRPPVGLRGLSAAGFFKQSVIVL